jgi:indolepyruvate ferredoxin oxidoreductase alpha subunit
MHSSQNEQDSRSLADFARIICLEPATQQQAYEMTREAFDLSEKFHIPVMIRLVTRLAHSRCLVRTSEARAENHLGKIPDPAGWILLPSNARRRWHSLLERQQDFSIYSENSPNNSLTLNDRHRELGVITTGIAENYFLENVDELPSSLPSSHRRYPLPVEKIRTLVKRRQSAGVGRRLSDP